MPTTVNARVLGVQHNGVFTDTNTGPIPGGRLWPEAAATWNAMRARFIADGGNPDHFKPGGPNSSARSLAAQRRFWSSQPPPAAVPGTSNHGWGIAVDIPFPDAQAWLRRNAGRYGWSHDEGARVGEPWHFRYRGLSKAALRKLVKDPLAGYTASERGWIREYDRLVSSRSNRPRRAVLKRVMAEQRKRIWKVAQPKSSGGDGKGWTRDRCRRYASLKARTTT